MSEPTDNDVPAPTIVIGRKGRRTADGTTLKVERRDFRHPVLLGERDLRRLQSQHTEFARHFAAKISATLRLEFELNFLKADTTTYGQFTGALPDPAHLALFKVEPLLGLGVVHLSPALGLAVTNRMLGGKGTTVGVNRDLTEIEVGLLEDFLRALVEEWCRQWPDVEDPRPLLVGHETNGKFLQTSAPGANVLVVTLEATLGDALRQPLQIAMPYSALEGRVKRSQAPGHRATEPAKQAPDPMALVRRAAQTGISLPATADWLVADITLRDALHLRAGDVLELPTILLTQTRIHLTGAPVFIGTAGLREGRIAVKLDNAWKKAAENRQVDQKVSPLPAS